MTTRVSDPEPVTTRLKSRVPKTLCSEMELACAANYRESENELATANRKFEDACDEFLAWTASMGLAEQKRRKEQKDYWDEQVHRHGSDKRHWLMQRQSWRECLSVHPEMVNAAAGSKCSHGYVTPMCVVIEPELKRTTRSREPGDDDE